MELESGSSLSRYRIGEKIGAGGMGVVYRAFDTRLERSVALKLLPAGLIGDAARRERFVREAKAASALNHANIVVVFDIDRVDTPDGEIDVLAMELVDGEPLDRRLARGPLAVEEALDLALDLADALAAAHRAGIVHRDVKPSNLLITADGRLKLLDFGLASASPLGVDSLAATETRLTAPGAVLGTPAYMAPEQARGHPVDVRGDVFAAGLVMYEMLSGRYPFHGDTPQELLLAVAHEPPEPLGQVRPDVPAGLRKIVERCLVKSPEDRYPSAAELHDALTGFAGRRSALGPRLWSRLSRPWIAAPLVALSIALVGAALWWAGEIRERRQVRESLSRLETLVAEHDVMAAFRLARELEPVLAGDPEFERLRMTSTWPYTIRSSPPGAEVAIRGYLEPPSAWIPVGVTPIEHIRLPSTASLFRLEKPGFVTVEGAPHWDFSTDALLLEFELWTADEAPPDTVRIPAGASGYGGPNVTLEPFWIGRHEVTNREYQAFEDAGGYADPSVWTEPFQRDGETIPWKEAMAELVDATGRTGPSTWRLGQFPDGRADHPVAGVSWYEAMAFARWVGADLPTLHHWFRAAEPDVFSEIIIAGNFEGLDTVPVGNSHAIGPFGTHDMAGNVIEWTSTGDGEGGRYIAGGGFGEPSYVFSEPGSVSPFDRGANLGLRLAYYDGAPSADAMAPIPRTEPPLSSRQPVGDEVFAAYRGFYDYDMEDELRESVDAVDDSSPHYRWERVSYDAAYGGERIAAHLLLPKNVPPPFQVVVYFPASPAERFASSQTLDGLPWFEFLPRSGRAVLLPIYKNTYERRIPDWEWSPAARRDLVIQWRKDLGRTIDYIESRDDLDDGRIAFYGFSLGAVYAPVLAALEPRIDALVLLGGGLVDSLPPEIDAVNFAPRVAAPTLMVTGRHDFVRPVATHQAPLLALLGVPPEQKRLAELDGGHLPSDFDEVVREILDWLDRWLGPVGRRAPP